MDDREFESTSERGTRKQRLKINPDLSALYGATITGEMKTSRGTSKITGKKVVRIFGGRGGGTGRGGAGRTRTTQ